MGLKAIWLDYSPQCILSLPLLMLVKCFSCFFWSSDSSSCLYWGTISRYSGWENTSSDVCDDVLGLIISKYIRNLLIQYKPLQTWVFLRFSSTIKVYWKCKIWSNLEIPERYCWLERLKLLNFTDRRVWRNFIPLRSVFISWDGFFFTTFEESQIDLTLKFFYKKKHISGKIFLIKVFYSCLRLSKGLTT